MARRIQEASSLVIPAVQSCVWKESVALGDYTVILNSSLRTNIMFLVCVSLLAGLPVLAADDHDQHDTHAHAEHHVEIGHGAPEGISQADFESPAWFSQDLAVWSFVVFITLLVLLTRFAWKPILEGLEKREQGIADLIAATQAANDDAKQLLASYEKRLAEASEEVREMLEEARRDSESTRQTIIAEARKSAEEERSRAQSEINLAKDKAISEIAEKAGRLAVDVAGKFLHEKLSDDDQTRLVRDSISSISGRPSIN